MDTILKIISCILIIVACYLLIATTKNIDAIAIILLSFWFYHVSNDPTLKSK